MIAKEDLRRIYLLDDLSDEMLDELVEITDFIEYEAGYSIFKEGDLADTFYMLRRGKVLLEERISTKATITIDTIRPGESFGVASLLDIRLHNLDAICSEHSKFFVIKGEDLKHIMNNNHSLGYRIMRKLSGIIGHHLERRTEQFLRAMKTHPDIHEIVQSEEEST